MNDIGSSDGTSGGLAELIRTGLLAKVVVLDGDDPLNKEVEVSVCNRLATVMRV
ncbi:TPA: hypothetical protein ACH3X1_009852 [Trebouxia sp. C0004]